jgi:hypothetical protein
MTRNVKGITDCLRRGQTRLLSTFRQFEDSDWAQIVYRQPTPWTVRDLLAHLVSAEIGLFHVARDVAEGGEGAPAGFDYDGHNATEQTRLANCKPPHLLKELTKAREQTIQWAAGLTERQLSLVGNHPGLGRVDLETILKAMHGHQLLHLRDLQAALRAPSATHDDTPAQGVNRADPAGERT